MLAAGFEVVAEKKQKRMAQNVVFFVAQKEGEKNTVQMLHLLQTDLPVSLLKVSEHVIDAS